MVYIIIVLSPAQSVPEDPIMHYLHDICFANVFDSFIFVNMLNTLRFKSFVLFGTNTL